MDKKIYIKDWLELKPYDRQSPTDSYYLKICNEVKNAITKDKNSDIHQIHLEDEGVDYLSCFLTSYFEDLISGTNIWNSFIRIHQRLYKKQLPFYQLEDYYEEEINVEDVCFLIWYYLNTGQDDRFITPFSKSILETAANVMDVFDSAWESAPENHQLKSCYQIDDNEKDYYLARNLIDTILFKTYLFHPDTARKLKDSEQEIVEQNKDRNLLMSYLNENRDVTLHKSHTNLLALSGKEWAAEIIGDKKRISSDLINISPRIVGYFLYKGQDQTDIFLEHIASGKKFNVAKKSFEHSAGLKKVDTIVFMGIAKWKGEWWFSGVMFQTDFDANLVSDEKKSSQSKMAVNFLDHQSANVSEILEKQLKAFKDFNKGSQIAFIPSDRVEKFANGFITFFNNSLNLSDKEIKKAIDKHNKEGFWTDGAKKLAENTKSALAFFNPKGGLEFVFDTNSAFPLANNPYFKKESSDANIMRLLADDSISTELVMYCINNCKTELPFFSSGVGAIFLKDIDFLLRFWKSSTYNTSPTITITG